MAQSGTMVVVTCSFTKRLGGTQTYRDECALASRLPQQYVTALLDRRRAVQRWLLRTATERWQGQSIHDIEYNRDLVCGPDFGGTECGLYLPAIERYDGRLYTALGEDGRRRVLGSRHHFLILSGLYGLAMPEEPVQCYSCPVHPQTESSRTWTDGPTNLTDILIAYLQRHGMRRVYDLSANAAYRQLVGWPRVRGSLGHGEDAVLHAFSRVGAGDNALLRFGRLLVDPRFEREIERLEPEHRLYLDDDCIAFMPDPEPPSGWPRETAGRRRDWYDEADRARRGAVRFMEALEGRAGTERPWGEGFSDRAKRLRALGLITRKDENALRTLGRLRNKSHYDGRPPDDRQFIELANACQHLRQRAAQKSFHVEEFETDLD